MRALEQQLAEFPDEASPIREALWFCDLTTTPGRLTDDLSERVAEIKQRYGPHDVVTASITEAEPDLHAALMWNRTDQLIRSAGP